MVTFMPKAPESTNGDSRASNGDNQDTFVEFAAARIRELAERGRHNATTLGQRVGVSKSSAALYWAGKRPWPTETLHLLADELQTTIDYLLGRTADSGVMEFRGSPAQFDEAVRLHHDATSIGDGADMVEIDHIDLRYGLGGTYAGDPVEVEKRPFPVEWVKSVTDRPASKLAWATGDGDSMEPTIRSGEVVLIDTSADRRRFDDTIWAVTLGDIGMIKRLRSRGETIELLSDNPLVPPQTAADGELHAVGRVIAVVRRL